jgi:hypothetical protein
MNGYQKSIQIQNKEREEKKKNKELK